MMDLIWQIVQPIIGELVVLAVVLGGILGLWSKGKRDQRRETALEAAEREAKTRKRMDDAEASTGDDPNLLRDWLHKRGQRKGDL